MDYQEIDSLVMFFLQALMSCAHLALVVSSSKLTKGAEHGLIGSQPSLEHSQ